MRILGLPNRVYLKLKSFVLGYRTLKNLKKRKGKDEIFLILSNQLGDCVYGLAYAESLREKSGKKLIIISDTRRKNLIESYHIDAEVVYLEKDSKEWRGTQCLNGSPYCIKKGIKWGIFNVVQWIVFPHDRYPNRSALDLIRREMLGLDKDATLSYPDFSNWPIRSIDDFENKKSHIAIINPYSYSMADVDFQLFDELSEILTGSGYLVYTNVIKDQKAVKCSERLDCPIEEFWAICNQVPLVISVRSGIIDLTIGTKANFFVLYFLSDKRSGPGFYGQYTLKSWNTHNVEEVIYQDRYQCINAFNNFLLNHSSK